MNSKEKEIAEKTAYEVYKDFRNLPDFNYLYTNKDHRRLINDTKKLIKEMILNKEKGFISENQKLKLKVNIKIDKSFDPTYNHLSAFSDSLNNIYWDSYQNPVIIFEDGLSELTMNFYATQKLIFFASKSIFKEDNIIIYDGIVSCDTGSKRYYSFNSREEPILIENVINKYKNHLINHLNTINSIK